MVLATCNRLEIIADVTAFHGSTQDLAEVLAKAVGSGTQELLPHLWISYGEQAARHLFEVASGLDSLVVGEQQIVGQVRDAMATAHQNGTAARRLHGVTQAALRCAKRVHTDTGIDRHGASVVSVGLRAAAEHLPDLSGCRVAVVGAGAMASLTVATLHERGVRDLVVVNRTPDNAARLAASVGARIAGLDQLPALVAERDLIITCTGSTDTILSAHDVAEQRAGAPGGLVVLDLALPHDTDPGLVELPGVVRIALTDLVDRPDTAASADDVDAAARIVEDELAAYLAQEAARRVDPLVVSLRARASQHVQDEADRLRLRLPGLSADEYAEIDKSLRRVVNAMLHTPTVRMKQWAIEPDGRRYADALHALFDLPASTIEAFGAPDGSEDEGWW